MNKQKGVSLYITIVIMTILLSIVLGLTNIIVTGAKIAGQFSDAVRAFSAADTGIENALYNLYKSGTCSDVGPTPIIDCATGGTIKVQGDNKYCYSFDVTGSCLSPTSISSTGRYESANTGATTRSIQVSF